jgi:hypothetical protein
MLTLLTASLLAAAGQNPPSSEAEVRDLCSARFFSQVEFGDCLKRYATQSALRLAKAERNALARIEHWDEDARYRAQAKAALMTSNAEFLRYRASECSFAATLAGGSIGTAHEHAQSACTYELNIRRAASLDGFVASLPQRTK